MTELRSINADSSPYTGEPAAAAGLLNGKIFYGTTRLAVGFRKTKEKGRNLSVPSLTYVLVIKLKYFP